jgi:hypothetical protein
VRIERKEGERQILEVERVVPNRDLLARPTVKLILEAFY